MRERLAAAPTVAARFHLLEQALAARLNVDRERRPLAYVVERLVDPMTPLSVRDLSDAVGFSQKHLIAQCKKYVGVTPKKLARIARFHRALQTIEPAGSPNWADIALRCGYFDQAHFNRDFVTFSGLTPGAYVAQRQAHFDTPPAHDSSVKFVPEG